MKTAPPLDQSDGAREELLAEGYDMRRNTEGNLAIGAVILVLLLNLAWWGFVVWAIYTLVTWVASK